jgi:histidinol phosphatase-like enzyme (inositol monophosphatase family)
MSETPPPVDPALLDTAVAVARQAGDATLRWYRSSTLEIETKDDGSPVTAADRAAERIVREEVGARFPDDAVIGEEEENTTGTSGRTWYVDPIDGTKSFVHGVPLYTTLLAVDDEHGPAVGVIHMPALGETVWAGRGRGCWHDDRPARVNDRRELAGAYVMTSGFDYWPAHLLARILTAPVVLRTWGDGYGYALVATGRADAMVDPTVNPYDIAPMRVVLTEAGGAFTDLAGHPRHDGGSGVATNGHLHAPLLEALRRA